MAVQSKHHFDLFIYEQIVEVIMKKELCLSKDNGLYTLQSLYMAITFDNEYVNT